jgi:hypothetical protein
LIGVGSCGAVVQTVRDAVAIGVGDATLDVAHLQPGTHPRGAVVAAEVTVLGLGI